MKTEKEQIEEGLLEIYNKEGNREYIYKTIRHLGLDEYLSRYEEHPAIQDIITQRYFEMKLLDEKKEKL